MSGDGPARGDDPERDPPSGPSPSPLRTDLSPIVDAVRDADAAAFVAVGGPIR
ncbi:hypothetical protein GJ633_14670 [Halorubrum sp. CBA1125]|uniref:hypothetical protein n=1 Tax=Halorubrum sp. CBA1125 TaxID=2668072 RepID=UPI0012E7A849|nr:hypothetical protein [Halorubrum sp. CBA1125]MUW15727.1 hypothetical protein [Halorubrum sp. CBA1125]